jgi:chitodextrinase
VEALEERAMLSVVAAYSFNEGTGSAVADSSGNGNIGNTANTAWSSGGKYGGALSFNGTNSIVNIPDSNSLHLSSGLTLEAWVKPTSITSIWSDVIYKGNDIFYLEASSPQSDKPAGAITVGSSEVQLFGTKALPVNSWTYLALTYDGANLRLYVNGAQVASVAQTGPIATSTNALQIGGDTIYGQNFAGLIDDVRVYNTARTSAQIQTDMKTPVAADKRSPSAPRSLTATPVGASQIDLSWSAASDNVGVTGYRVERLSPGSSKFVQIGTPSSTKFSDTGLAPRKKYFYRVRAVDAAGNLGPYSPLKSATTKADKTAPAVSIASPGEGATLTGNVTISATAFDNVAVAGVQFLLDGAALGPEDTAAPYSFSWDTSKVSLGPHTLSARARDTAGNRSVSKAITVNVANPNDPAAVGQWSPVIDFPLVAINSILLNNGKILMWSGQLCIGGESATVWDPATNTFTPVPLANPDGSDRDIFCSGMTVLPDGDVLQAGGHACNDPNYLGTAIATEFDPVTDQWTIEPDMANRRWYPTIITMADGRAIIIGGGDKDFTPYSYSKIPEVFDPQTDTWTTLTDAVQTIPNYAFVFALPDGRILAAGSDEAKMATYALDVATQTWSVIDPTVLDAGSAVMYLPGKVMKTGSSYIAGDQTVEKGIPSLATTYVLDMTQPNPAWQQTASMANARTHLNLTVLPDGNVLATGGSTDISGEFPENAVLPAEMWSPATQTWTTLASMQTPRMYHSTALLLPDGRILSAGGGRTGDSVSYDYANAEIYSPPYLFKGARPTITAAPSTVNYNSSFFVQTPDASSIASVSLIRNGSVTHAFNMDQRFVPLSFTKTASGLNVQAPADANLAPPGYYMLFIVNNKGVPSIAPFVHLPASYEVSQSLSMLANQSVTGSPAPSLNFAASNQRVVQSDLNLVATSDVMPPIANQIAPPAIALADSTRNIDASSVQPLGMQPSSNDVSSAAASAWNASIIGSDDTDSLETTPAHVREKLIDALWAGLDLFDN